MVESMMYSPPWSRRPRCRGSDSFLHINSAQKLLQLEIPLKLYASLCTGAAAGSKHHGGVDMGAGAAASGAEPHIRGAARDRAPPGIRRRGGREKTAGEMRQPINKVFLVDSSKLWRSLVLSKVEHRLTCMPLW